MALCLGEAMRFHMLGPLEAVDGDQRLALGGIKQRATLAFLLFHANRAVPVSQLMEALWSLEPPVTARKILQNAVWSLRGALCSRACADESVELLTQPPGYMLRVNTDEIDLYLFNRWVSEGRAELAAGSAAAAAVRLREALSLWQGSVLADLVEAGITWPEITSAQNARLDATEDCFEAELACGRHQSVLGALTAMVRTEPLRERLCGQLMLALYRCGRQADALNVYSRVRSALVEDLGLEPCRELQVLQQAILAQDAGLDLPGTQPQAEPITLTTLDTSPPAPPPPPPAVPAAECRQVSVLLVRAQPELGDRHRVREGLTDLIKNVVGSMDGTTVASIGSVTLALFGATGDRAVDVRHAVRAATAIRGGLGAASGADGGNGPSTPRVIVQAAVTTGEAIVRYDPNGTGALLSADGPLLDECDSLLSLVPPGEIWACDETRRATAATMTYTAVGDSPARWRLEAADPRHVAPAAPVTPVADHELELSVLLGLLERVRHRRVPHVVTLLGEANIGKSHLIMEFERRVMGQPERTQFLIGHAPLFARNNVLAIQEAILASVDGLMRRDPARTAGDKAARALWHLTAGEQKSGRLLSLLGPLVAAEAAETEREPPCALGDSRAAALRFFGEIARNCPLVMIVEDLHRADDVVLDFVHDLADHMKPVSLLVIATARPDLFTRRPGWGGGKRRFTTITMDPAVESASPRAEEFLQFATRNDAIDSRSWLRGSLLRSAPYS